MSTYQQIQFSVKKEAVDDVKQLIRNYARYVADYAEKHGEEWSWSTYQSMKTPTDFVSVISHEDRDAELRHMDAEGTKQFAESLYVHVTANEQAVDDLVASSTT